MSKVGTNDFKPTKPKVPKGSIFDKLTDSSQYTGSHKSRFDSEGKGRGRAGRDLGALGRGSVPAPVAAAPKTKKSPRKTGSVQSGKMGSADFKPTKPKTKKGSIFDRLTDSSKYTGSHKNRFDADGKGRGRAGRDLGAVGSGTASHSVASYPERT